MSTVAYATFGMRLVSLQFCDRMGAPMYNCLMCPRVKPTTGLPCLSTSTGMNQSPVGHGHDTLVCLRSPSGLYWSTNTPKRSALCLKVFSIWSVRIQHHEGWGAQFQMPQRTLPAITRLSGGCKLDCSQRFLRAKSTGYRRQCERAFFIMRVLLGCTSFNHEGSAVLSSHLLLKCTAHAQDLQ